MPFPIFMLKTARLRNSVSSIRERVGGELKAKNEDIQQKVLIVSTLYATVRFVH